MFPILVCVVFEDVHAVEDGGGVPEHVENDVFVDRRVELVVELDGGFVDFGEATVVGDGEHFDIESPGFDQEARHDGVEDCFFENFHTGLGVADVEPK